MNRPRWWLVAPALLASAVFSAATAAEVRDKAGLFSPGVVKQAQTDLARLEKEYEVPVIVETVDSLDGVSLSKALERRAEAVDVQGVYILIPKQEHKILAEAEKHFREHLSRSKMEAVQDAFLAQFKKGDFDAGLTDGVAKLGSVFSAAKAESGGSIRQNAPPKARRGGVAVPVHQAPPRTNTSGGFSLMWLIIGGLAIFFVIRIIGGLMRSMSGGNQYGGGNMMGNRGGYPGPGGPGYGGGYGGAPAGGGGFMSSLFGGIGGAMAGNWLYDKMSGNQHGGNYADQTGYDAAGAAPVEDAGTDYGNNDAGADWGGGEVADNSGGGGGGDWGGGDGGGGGGDWGGGGDDNGGSW